MLKYKQKIGLFYHSKKKAISSNKKKHDKIDFVMFLVVPSGLEPEQAVPETDVLPLHHKTILRISDLFSSIAMQR